MGFRFSKRITIIPGVRLNISKSGVSTSIGPRGMSVSLGKNGAYLNTGLPGTGLSYRQRIGGSARGAQEQSRHPDEPSLVTVSISDDGQILIRGSDGSVVSESFARRIKQERAQEISELLRRYADAVNAGIEDCQGIHLKTPRPGDPPKLPAPFNVPAPAEPLVQAPGVLARMFGAKDNASDADIAYRQELATWEEAKRLHEESAAAIEKSLRLASKGYSAHMDSALDYVFSGISWPRETLVEYEVSDDALTIGVDVDLPDEDDVPAQKAEISASGKLSLKKISDAQRRKLFSDLCHSSIFRVAGEVLALMPTIEQCVVSGYIQRKDPATGRIVDDYIISVIITREEWSQIDFSSLGNIEPEASLRSFGARISTDRGSRFRAITPYTIP